MKQNKDATRWPDFDYDSNAVAGRIKKIPTAESMR